MKYLNETIFDGKEGGSININKIEKEHEGGKLVTAKCLTLRRDKTLN